MVSEGTIVFSLAALCCTNFAKDPDGGAFFSLRSTLREESAADKLGRLAGGGCAGKEFLMAIPLRFMVGRFCPVITGAGGWLLEAFVDNVLAAAAAAVVGAPDPFLTRPIRVEALAAGAPRGGCGGGGGGGLFASPKTPGLIFAANFF